jgi:hypothetical protein
LVDDKIPQTFQLNTAKRNRIQHYGFTQTCGLPPSLPKDTPFKERLSPVVKGPPGRTTLQDDRVMSPAQIRGTTFGFIPDPNAGKTAFAKDCFLFFPLPVS